MAVTKIHGIKTTVDKAIEYICNPDKTDQKLARIYIFLPLPALPKQPFLTLNTLWIIHMTAEIRTIQIRHFI